METSSESQDPQNGIFNIFLFVMFFVIVITNAMCSLARDEISYNNFLSKIHIIDGDQLQSSKTVDYIYYYTENMNYSGIKDSLFGFSHKCGLLKRKVQYCQWIEISHSRNIISGNKSHIKYYYTYEKHWLENQKSSKYYHNPIYMNPTVKTIDAYSHRNAKIQAGAYLISPNMTMKGNRTIFVPSYSKLEEMQENRKTSEFKYAGRGIFYSLYERPPLDDIFLDERYFDLIGEKNEWCTPGDRRIYFESWEPTNATIIGKRKGNIIEPFEYNNKLIGSIQSGKIELNNTLSNYNIVNFNNGSKYEMLYIIIAYFFITLLFGTPDVCVSAYLLFCSYVGYRIPYVIGGNGFTDFLLSLVLAFCLVFVRIEETYEFYKAIKTICNERNYNQQNNEEYKLFIKKDNNNKIQQINNYNNNNSAYNDSLYNSNNSLKRRNINSDLIYYYDGLDVEVGNSDNDHDTIVNNSDSNDSNNYDFNHKNDHDIIINNSVYDHDTIVNNSDPYDSNNYNFNHKSDHDIIINNSVNEHDTIVNNSDPDEFERNNIENHHDFETANTNDYDNGSSHANLDSIKDFCYDTTIYDNNDDSKKRNHDKENDSDDYSFDL